jgi:hypothetical protein
MQKNSAREDRARQYPQYDGPAAAPSPPGKPGEGDQNRGSK